MSWLSFLFAVQQTDVSRAKATRPEDGLSGLDNGLRLSRQPRSQIAVYDKSQGDKSRGGAWEEVEGSVLLLL